MSPHTYGPTDAYLTAGDPMRRIYPPPMEDMPVPEPPPPPPPRPTEKPRRYRCGHAGTTSHVAMMTTLIGEAAKDIPYVDMECPRCGVPRRPAPRHGLGASTEPPESSP